ncbi:MAG: signal peptidase II [Holosporaceae bacterium]|nr:MAG: signal peptidase II [Holosporaceae bacterium]
MKFNLFPWIIVSVSVCLDQISKLYILRSAPFLPEEIFSFLSIVFVKNKGISFGLFNHKGTLVFWVITLVIIFLTLYVAYMLYNAKKRDSMWGLSLVLGGALGNIIDRFFHGGVIDFIDFHYAAYHWPAFNFADSFIFIGVALLFKSNLKEHT